MIKQPVLITLANFNETNGTSLQGYITATFDELVLTLGAPQREDLDKVTVEWAFRTLNGVVFTIYDYKCYSTPKNTYAWHIGGSNAKAVVAVAQLFPNHKVEVR